MEKGYYYPEKEEFHKGFEYEVYVPADEVPPEGLLTFLPLNVTAFYQKHTFPDPFLGYDVDKMFNSYKLRVKKLNQEDIESLGWKRAGVNALKDIVYYEGKGEWFSKPLPLSPEYKFWEYKLSHDIKYDGVRIEIRISNGDTETFFEGLIKNKSELKKVMLQIGII